MSLLSTERLVKSYHHRRVVNGVSIEVNPGEIVGLLGPNGAGKTTTFNMVVGVVRPDEGAVRFEDREITRAPMHERARLGVGYLTQEPSVFRKLTVEQNILAILETCRLSAQERQIRLRSLLDELDLARLAKSKAYQLSGGEKRRLEITRSLVISPKLLLLDEPFAGIDPIAVFEVQKIIRRLKQRGLGILMPRREGVLEVVVCGVIRPDGCLNTSLCAAGVAGTEGGLGDHEDVGTRVARGHGSAHARTTRSHHQDIGHLAYESPGSAGTAGPVAGGTSSPRFSRA